MRDPNRIEAMLAIVNDIWRRNPDMRFNQLIYNLQRGYSEQNEGYGAIQSHEDPDGLNRTGYDFFHLADADFIKYLKQVSDVGMR
jgi:hypothetical protein